MNKTLLLAGVATALFAFNANAMDFNQYVSAKGAFVKMKNDTFVDSDYSFGGVTHHYNKILDNNHKDDVWGVRLAYGTSNRYINLITLFSHFFQCFLIVIRP